MSAYTYCVSGLKLQADRPLQGVPQSLPAVHPAWRLRRSAQPLFRTKARRVRFMHGRGTTLELRWPTRGLFTIQPQRHTVLYTPAPQVSPRAFADIVLTNVVAHLLVLEGSDPLHGCAVNVGGRAICFLGQSGAGKSTMAASFLLAGHALITDDVLAVAWHQQQPCALPGYPEIRLWPGSGKRLIRTFARLPQVVSTASKRRLDPREAPAGFARHPVPLATIYELRRSTRVTTPRIETIEPREALMALVRNLYNATLLDADILARQFRHLNRLSRHVPIRRLTLPRATPNLRQLPRIVLKDLARHARRR